jgi:hypothetical protein
MPRSSQWSLAFGPPNENPVNTSPLPHACHMSRLPHPPWFNQPNTIRWRIQVMKFIIMQFSDMYNIWRKWERHTKVLFEILKRKEHFGDLGTDERTITKRILKEIMC